MTRESERKEMTTIRKIRYFTMIELLIVISIIAILVGILLPALNRAREKAQSMKCVGNLHSIFQCLTFYTDDNDSWGPAANENVTGDSSGYRKWQDQCNYYLNKSEYKDRGYCENLGGNLYRAKGIFHCPASKIEFNAGTECYDYGINMLMSANASLSLPQYLGRRIFRIKQPSKRAWISDLENPNSPSNQFSKNSTTGLSNASMRHNLKPNILFVAGAVLSYNYTQIPFGTGNAPYETPFWGWGSKFN